MKKLFPNTVAAWTDEAQHNEQFRQNCQPGMNVKSPLQVSVSHLTSTDNLASPQGTYLCKDSASHCSDARNVDADFAVVLGGEGDASDQGPPPHLDLTVLAELPDESYDALFFLSYSSWLRKLCRQIYTDKRFGTLVLFLIVANSVLMMVVYAWPGCEPHPCGLEPTLSDNLDLFFTIAFTVEMIIKIVALGFIMHPRSYLRFGWNVLDSVTVVASWLEKGGDFVPNASILRLLRVLRPLRTMSRVRGLRTLMGALFGAMPEIRDNIVLLGFLVLIFAILGVQLFAGKLHNRCIVIHGNYSELAPNDTASDFVVPFLLPALANGNAQHCGGTLSCHEEQFLEGTFPNTSVRCDSDEILRNATYRDDLVRDPLDYDNLGSAVLLIFKVFTGDDWPEDMNELQNASGLNPPFFFFFFCIMVGGLFATNLFLAVLISAYYTNARKSQEDMEESQKKAMLLWEQYRKGGDLKEVVIPDKSIGALALLSKGPKTPAPPHAHRYTHRFSARRTSAATTQHRTSTAAAPSEQPRAGAAAIPDLSVEGGTPAFTQVTAIEEDPARQPLVLLAAAAAPPPCTSSTEPADRSTACGGSDRDSASAFADRTETGGQFCGGAAPEDRDAENRRSSAPPEFVQSSFTASSARNVAISPSDAPSRTRRISLGTADARVRHRGSIGGVSDGPASVTFTHQHRDSVPNSATIRRRRPTFAAANIPTESDEELLSRFDSKGQLLPPAPPCLSERSSRGSIDRTSALGRIRRQVGDAVQANATQNFIMLVTCFNVLVLAMDHYGVEEKRAMADFMCFAGLVCFFIFAGEILLKIFGLGLRRTFTDAEVGAGYNIFDLVLVVSSVPGVISTNLCLSTETGSGGAFSAFRAFRMLRALRVLRRWPSVHALLKALVSCLSEGVYVSLLLLLQIFIFSILGMQLFEGKFPIDTERLSPPSEDHFRQNFNSLWEAALTCFVIITGDAWGAIMKQGMQHTSDGACVYFLFVFLLGNYVLVNVFVAVILDKLDAATSELELTEVLIEVEGALHGCTGIYMPYPDSTREHVWIKRDEEHGMGPTEGPDARFLYSTGEDGYWVIWHSEEREPDEGYLTSQDHNGRMPQEIDVWRHEWADAQWDPHIRVFEYEECAEVEREENAGLDLLAKLDQQAAPRATVQVGTAGTLQSQAGVTLDDGLRVSDVAFGSPCAPEGVNTEWQLDKVGGVPVRDLQEAKAAFARKQGSDDLLDLEFRELTVAEKKELMLCFDATDPDGYQGQSLMQRLLYAPYVELLGHSCIPTRSGLRREMGKIVNSYMFDAFIVAVIGFNVVFLAFDYPKASSGLRQALDISDYVFTGIFFVEMVMKIVAMGFWSQTHDRDPDRADELGAYFRDPWNCIDCFVVVTAVGALVPQAPDDLKVFRSLRTLRLVTRSVQLRIVIEALVRTVPAVTQGLVVCAFIFFVFSILGTQLFKGTFYQCSDDTVTIKENCSGEYFYTGGPLGNTVMNGTRTWDNAADHFDNVGQSLFTLIVVAIGEGWSPIMYQGIDTVGQDKAGKLNNQPWISLYFVSFHVVGNFFCLNLIIGILISEFTNQRRSLDGTQGSNLSEKQQSYIAAEKAVLIPIMFKQRPTAPESDYWGIRNRCFNAVHDANFDRLVTSVIIINMLILSTQHHNQSTSMEDFQHWGNWWCSVIFTAEAIVKLSGLGPGHYFREGWNRFDFTIVLVSLSGMFIPIVAGFSAVRVLRVGRLFRLVEHAKGLQKLFNTMFQGDNFVYFGNIGIFCLAILFMFAVAGVNLFGDIEKAEGVDHNMNFDNVWNALITLFAIWTTEAWLDVRDGLVKGAPEGECGGPGQGSCGRPVLGNMYAISFIVVAAVVVLNLFAAVVVELFDKQEAQERCSKEIESIGQFRDRWRTRFGPVDVVSEVPAVDFVAALQDHDNIAPTGQLLKQGGLLPNRLRRLPRARNPGTAPSWDLSEEVNLSLEPTDVQLLAYVHATGIPLRQDPDTRRAMVRYSDAVFCLAARAFGLQNHEVQEIHRQKHQLSRGPVIGPDAFLLSHWVAVSLLVKKLRFLRKRLKQQRKRQVTTESGRLLTEDPVHVLSESPIDGDCSAADHFPPASKRGLSAGSSSSRQPPTLAPTPPFPPPAGGEGQPAPAASPEGARSPEAAEAPAEHLPDAPAVAPDLEPGRGGGAPYHSEMPDLPASVPSPMPSPPRKPRKTAGVDLARSKVRALLTPLSEEERKQITSPEVLETKEQKVVSARTNNASLRSELALLQQQWQTQWDWKAPS